jgi:hypothetical protein
MHVEMRHFLVPVRAHIGQDSIARRFQSQLLRHRTHRGEKARDLRRAGVRAEVGQRHERRLWDHQNMHRRTRRDFGKCQRPFVLIEALARQLAAQDAREDIGVIVGGKTGDGRGGFAMLCRRCACDTLVRQGKSGALNESLEFFIAPAARDQAHREPWGC